MKRTSIITVIALLITFSTSYAQNVDKILKDHFDATGQKKISEVKSQIITGKSIITSMGMNMPFVITLARPHSIRVESTFQGSKMIQTYDGEKAWVLAPMMGRSEPTELTGNELKLIRNQSDMDGPLWDYERKGNTVEYIGEEMVKESPAHHLKVTTPEGDIIHQYIDKKTNLLVKTATTQTMGGAETELENLYSEYKTVKGITMAHVITTRMNGETITSVEIDDVEFNKSVDPELFKKPSL